MPIVFSAFVTHNAQDGLQYVWVRSLAVSLSIVSCAHWRWQWWPLSTEWDTSPSWITFHAVHMHAAQLASAFTALRPFWMNELSCCLWYNGQNVSDFYQGGGRSVIFLVFVWTRWRRERKRGRERSVAMKSGSQRFETAGLSYIKQVSSADKKASQAGREKNTGRGGKKQSKKRALCSLSNERETTN